MMMVVGFASNVERGGNFEEKWDLDVSIESRGPNLRLNDAGLATLPFSN